MKKSIYSDLPQIVYIYAVEDHGEDGAATCPHCNAIGRYIVKFQCEDGTTRGAMRGCFQKFPISTLARYHAAIVEKQKEYSAKGWSLNQFDTAMLEIIERHARGGRENWRDPTSPGALARYLLWNKPTLAASLADYRRRFRV